MKRFKDYSTNYLDRLGNLLKQIDFGTLEKIAGEIVRAYQEDRTVYVAGNGGSASTATHMSCDLSKGTVSPIHRRLRVTSLNDNMAWFSAIATLTSHLNRPGSYDRRQSKIPVRCELLQLRNFCYINAIFLASIRVFTYW
jgi:SIS domain